LDRILNHRISILAPSAEVHFRTHQQNYTLEGIDIALRFPVKKLLSLLSNTRKGATPDISRQPNICPNKRFLVTEIHCRAGYDNHISLGIRISKMPAISQVYLRAAFDNETSIRRGSAVPTNSFPAQVAGHNSGHDN
jgi:hypothetical protein